MSDQIRKKYRENAVGTDVYVRTERRGDKERQSRDEAMGRSSKQEEKKEL